MKQPAQPPALGKPQRSGWVQTERATHEAWARFTLRKPTASACLHYMCSYMGDQNALVIPQSVLAKKMGVSLRTISSAISELEKGCWIQIVKLGKGKESAYVINDRVAWDKPRGQLNLSLFKAMIVADADDQDADALENSAPLRRLPALYPFEHQLPSGPGEAPPSQPSLAGLEPDLPATVAVGDADPMRIDPETGEITYL